MLLKAPFIYAKNPHFWWGVAGCHFLDPYFPWICDSMVIGSWSWLMCVPKLCWIWFGWWFQIFFIFTPIPGEMIQFDEYFSNGWFNHQLVIFLKFGNSPLLCLTHGFKRIWTESPIFFWETRPVSQSIPGSLLFQSSRCMMIFWCVSCNRNLDFW